MKLTLYDDDGKILLEGDPATDNGHRCIDRELKEIYQESKISRYFSNTQTTTVQHYHNSCDEHWARVVLKRVGLPECMQRMDTSRIAWDTRIIKYRTRDLSGRLHDTHASSMFNCVGCELSIGIFMVMYEGLTEHIRKGNLKAACVSIIPKQPDHVGEVQKDAQGHDMYDATGQYPLMVKARPSFEFNCAGGLDRDYVETLGMEPISIFQGRRIVNMLKEDGTIVWVKLATNMDESYSFKYIREK